jgi:hypothetical protein
MERGVRKQRGQECYNTKVERMKKWHERLVLLRESGKDGNENGINKNTKMKPILKELKPIEFYIGKIKKPTGGK